MKHSPPVIEETLIDEVLSMYPFLLVHALE